MKIITFITSSKLLLQLCDICFNYGLVFEAFSLLLISYRSLNPFRLYHAYTLCLIFSEEKSICHTLVPMVTEYFLTKRATSSSKSFVGHEAPSSSSQYSSTSSTSTILEVEAVFLAFKARLLVLFIP